jgi:trimeric autotransporter adhesin
MITFDTQLLTSFYLSGASLSATTRRAMAVSAGATQRGPSVIAPWQFPQVGPSGNAEKLLQILGTANAFDLNDPSLDRPGVDDNFRNLFALYNGLGLMADLAEMASADRVEGTSRGVLQRKFDGMMTELTAFLSENTYDDISIIKGLKVDNVTTGAIVPPSFPDRRIEGGVINDTRDQAIPGIDTQTFHIDITNANGLNTVTIDLSLVSGTKSVDNIVDYINTQLEDADLQSRIETNRFSEFEYGFMVVQNAGEGISFRPDPADQGPSALIAGDTGFDNYTQMFLRKFDDVGTAAPNEAFFEEFGADEARDAAQGIAVDSQGNVYVVGTTEGNLDGQNSTERQDIFLTKYDSVGNELFTRLLGTSTGTARAFDIEVDSQDNVVIAGTVVGELSIDSFGGGIDGFVAKFDTTGQELFVRQQSPPVPDATVAIAIDGDDNIIVGGYVEKIIGDGVDSSFLTLDPNGALLSDKVFGDFTNARVIDVTVMENGNTLVLSDANGIVRLNAFDGPNLLFAEQIGDVGEGGAVTGFATDSTGIYVTGTTTSDALGGTIIGANHNGGMDAFVIKAGLDGKVQRHAFLGTGGNERGTGIAVHDGEIFITGSTDDLLTGPKEFGSLDGFVAKFDSLLGSEFVEQFRGSYGFGTGTAIAIDPTGSSVLSKLGIPTGNLPQPDALSVTANTSVRPDQQFSISVNGGRAKRITIGAEDSFRFLSIRINAALGAYGRAKLINSGEDGGRALTIEAKNGAVIEILAGPEGRDALPGLGINPTTLFGDAALGQESALSDSAFGLGLIGEISLLNSQTASDAAILLRSAQSAVKKAFKFLTDDGSDPLANAGPPPAYLLKRISNMTEGLRRLTGGQADLFT